MNSHFQWLPPRFKWCAIMEQPFGFKLYDSSMSWFKPEKWNSRVIRRWSRGSHADETFKGRCAIDWKSQSNFLLTKYSSAPIDVQSCIIFLLAIHTNVCLRAHFRFVSSLSIIRLVAKKSFTDACSPETPLLVTLKLNGNPSEKENCGERNYFPFQRLWALSGDRAAERKCDGSTCLSIPEVWKRNDLRDSGLFSVDDLPLRHEWSHCCAFEKLYHKNFFFRLTGGTSSVDH